MLTVEGVYGFSGLGFVKGVDFSCTNVSPSVYRCVAKIGSGALAVYKDLQATVAAISAQMSAAKVLSMPSQLAALEIDGQPGNTTAIGVLFIGAAFLAAVPPTDPVLIDALTSSGDAKADIEKIAANAAEITAYFKDVLVNHPEALRPPPQVVEKIIEKEKIIQKEFGTKFRPIGALVITAAFLGALGLAAASAYFLSHPDEGANQEF
jgi:hypothetical protein